MNNSSVSPSAADDMRVERLRLREARKAAAYFTCHVAATALLLVAAFWSYLPTLVPLAHPGDIRAVTPLILGGVSKTAGLCLTAWAYASFLPSSVLPRSQRFTLLTVHLCFLVLLFMIDGEQ